MIAYRLAVFGGLAASLPVVVWFAGAIAPPDVSAIEARWLYDIGMEALWTALALVAALFAGFCGTRPSPLIAGRAQLVLLATPAPVFCLAWLAGAASAGALVRGFLLLGAGSLLIIAVCRGARALPRGVVQIAFAAGIIATRQYWLGWIGV